MSIINDLVARFDVLASTRSNVESKWQDVERHVCPYRGDFFREDESEQSADWSRYGDDYDSTAVIAHQNLAAKIHGAVTSPSIRWFDMKFRDDDLNDNRVASEWLDEASGDVYSALQDSNLDLQINETYQDLTGFGTAAITLEEMPGPKAQWNGCLFTSIPLKESYFENDYLGRVLRFFRPIMMTPAEIISQFGTAGVPDTVLKAEAAGSTERMKVLYSFYPINNRIVPVGQSVSPSKRPWESCYILYNDKTLLGKKGSHYEMSVFIPRWRKSSGSVWGNSPAMMAMGDIKTLNTLVKQDLVRGEKEVDPPIVVPSRGMLTQLDLRAGEVSVCQDPSQLRELFPQNSPASTFERIARLQDNIKEYFFVPGLQALLVDNKQRTAYEIARMQEEILQMLGPTMGRIQNDLLNPIISRTFRMMARKGAIKPPPPIVRDKGAEFDIEYIGPLARAMRMEEANVIRDYVAFANEMAAMVAQTGAAENPLDNLNVDAAMRRIGKRMGVPAEVVRDSDEVEIIRVERQEKQRAMQEAMIAEQQGLAAQAQQEAATVGQQ